MMKNRWELKWIFIILYFIFLQDIDDFLSSCSAWKVVLVGEDKKRDASKRRLCKQLLKLLLGALELLLVGSIDDVDDGVDATAVTLPHATETGLTADIPHLDGHVPLGDLLHVEANSRDHVFLEGPRLYIKKINKQINNKNNNNKSRTKGGCACV